MRSVLGFSGAAVVKSTQSRVALTATRTSARSIHGACLWTCRSPSAAGTVTLANVSPTESLSDTARPIVRQSTYLPAELRAGWPVGPRLGVVAAPQPATTPAVTSHANALT